MVRLRKTTEIVPSGSLGTSDPVLQAQLIKTARNVKAKFDTDLPRDIQAGSVFTVTLKAGNNIINHNFDRFSFGYISLCGNPVDTYLVENTKQTITIYSSGAWTDYKLWIF